MFWPEEKVLLSRKMRSTSPEPVPLRQPRPPVAFSRVCPTVCECGASAWRSPRASMCSRAESVVISVPRDAGLDGEGRREPFSRQRVEVVGHRAEADAVRPAVAVEPAHRSAGRRVDARLSHIKNIIISVKEH